MNIDLLTVESARTAIAHRQVTATALVEEFYRKIDAENAQLNAYLTVCRDRALTQATKIDSLAEKGDPLPPLAGVPIAIKDVMVTRGVRTTAGSKILGNFVPPYDCTAVARLEAGGAVGLKPTYGRVSRYGLIAFASSLDHIGPLTKTVKDAAILLQHIAGRDPLDSTSADLPVPDYEVAIGKSVRGVRVGVASEYFG